MCNSLKIKSPKIQIVLSLSKTHMKTVYKSNSSTYEVIHMKTGVSKFLSFPLLRGSQVQLFQLIILATCHKTCLLLCLEISLLDLIHRHLSLEAREVIFCYSWPHVTHAHLILYHSNIIIILNMLIDSVYVMTMKLFLYYSWICYVLSFSLCWSCLVYVCVTTSMVRCRIFHKHQVSYVLAL